MQTLKNKGKIKMTLQDRVGSSVNGTGTNRKIDAPLTQVDSRDVLQRAMRNVQ